VPACGGWPLVRRRDVREGRRRLAVRVPGGGPAWPGDRRIRLGTPRHRAARTFFIAALTAHGEPEEVVTDLARPLEHVIEEVVPAAFHNTSQYANNRVECDHGRLKARLGPMRGLKTDPTARVIIRGHAFMQNLRRGHYELGGDASNQHLRVAAGLDELARAI
jgi:transposase, IS6 family